MGRLGHHQRRQLIDGDAAERRGRGCRSCPARAAPRVRRSRRHARRRTARGARSSPCRRRPRIRRRPARRALLQAAPPMSVVLKAQIEQRIGATGRRGALRRGQRRQCPARPAAARRRRRRCPRRRSPRPDPRTDDSVAQRPENLGRQMRFLRPAADDCFLHGRLPRISILIRGLSDPARISPQIPRQIAPESLGKHANFVINFCQIVFEAETTRIPRGADHESVR